MDIKKKIKMIITGISMLGMMCNISIVSCAKDNDASVCKYDVVSKEYVKTISTNKKYVSISPQIAAIDIPQDIANVNLNVVLTCNMQYDSITGKYVSATSPTVSLQYNSKVALRLDSVSTSYRDNGNSVTFSYNAKLLGTAIADSGVVCSIDYGKINGSYTIKK